MGISTNSIFAAATRFQGITAAIGTLGPIIGILIDTAQKLVPKSENAGVTKFNAVLDGAKTYLVGLGNIASEVEQLVPTLALGINAAVEAYKGRLVQNPQTGQWVQVTLPTADVAPQTP